MSKRPWTGLFPAIRRLFYGKANPPKAKRYGETSTPTISCYYEGMHRYYRWFRQDSFTRKYILTNAYFATMTAGFARHSIVRCYILNEELEPKNLLRFISFLN